MLFTKLGESICMVSLVCVSKCEFRRPGVQAAKSSGGQGFRSLGDQEFRRPRIGQEAFIWCPGVH